MTHLGIPDAHDLSLKYTSNCFIIIYTLYAQSHQGYNISLVSISRCVLRTVCTCPV